MFLCGPNTRADQQLLCQLYDAAKARPLTSTRLTLRIDEGLGFNGTFAGGMPSRCKVDWLLSSTCLVFKWPRIDVCLNVPQLSMNRSLCKFQFVHACRAALLIGFEEGRKPAICKFTVDPQDVVREAKVEDLWREPALTRVVGPVKLVKVNAPRIMGTSRCTRQSVH